MNLMYKNIRIFPNEGHQKSQELKDILYHKCLYHCLKIFLINIHKRIFYGRVHWYHHNFQDHLDIGEHKIDCSCLHNPWYKLGRIHLLYFLHNIRQDISRHKLMLFYLRKFILRVYFDTYSDIFLNNYLRNRTENKKHMMWHIFLLHFHHMNKSLKDKHLHTLLSMDHPNIFLFIKLPHHKLEYMSDWLDYQNIHLNKYTHMYVGKDLHKQTDFVDIRPHKV